MSNKIEYVDIENKKNNERRGGECKMKFPEPLRLKLRAVAVVCERRQKKRVEEHMHMLAPNRNRRCSYLSARPKVSVGVIPSSGP